MGHSPFAAAPLIADVDGDGGLDIVASPFGEVLTVLQGENGKPIPNSRWPAVNLDSSVLANPLQVYQIYPVLVILVFQCYCFIPS